MLIIEQSVGVSGSMMSLCSLLDHLDLSTFEIFAVFSREEQQRYWKDHAEIAVETTVIGRSEGLKNWLLTSSLKRLTTALGPFVRILFQKSVALLDFLVAEMPNALRLALYCRNKRIDLVVHNNSVCAPAVILSRILGVPLVVIQRGSEWQSAMMRYLARFVTFGVANSEATLQDLVLMGIPDERLAVIHPPLDVKRFNPEVDSEQVRLQLGLAPSVPCFGIVGLLFPWKGQDVFLKAARLVLEKLPNAVALVVGKPPAGNESFERELKDLAAQLQISKSVMFTGFRTDIPNLMKMMDVVVLASTLPEPFGRVIVEAMGVGTPVVATRPGGPSEIIKDGATGYLVPPNDPETMADRIAALLSDRERAKRMGREAALDVGARFSAQSQTDRLAAIFLRACARCSPSSVGVTRP